MKSIRLKLKKAMDAQPVDARLLALRYKELLELRRRVRLAEQATGQHKPLSGDCEGVKLNS